MKRGLILIILILLFIPFLSASLQSSMDEVNSYVEQYKQGEISASQLIVYVEYVKNKMYEVLDQEGKRAFNENEIKTIFEKTSDMDKGAMQYEKKFMADDFYLIFKADSFFRHDKAYYEEREEDTQNYYVINYDLRAIDSGGPDLSNNLKNFISDLKNLINGQGSAEKEEELKKDFNKLKQKFWNMQDQDSCIKLMKDIGMTENEESFGKDRYFNYKILEEFDKNCWTNSECDWICDSKEICEECESFCEDEEICEEVCEDVEICSGEGENKSCETNPICEEICSMQEVCQECEKNCWREDDCHDECKDVEQCEEFVSAEIRLESNCRKDGADIWISSWGEGFDKYQHLNDGGEWTCENEIKNLVKLRKVLQESINNEFAKWYFEEFLNGNDYDKIINGGNGFENAIQLLIRNEEEIAQNLHCSETKEWPKGFEKIDITYINNNTHVEVWEKNIPVEWGNAQYFTTLYKYSWTPDYEMLKGLINYQLEKTQTIGPTAGDIVNIRADEGQMQLVNALADNYGGSFDIKLELNENNNDFVVKKYLQVNPDEVIKFVDTIEEKEDISIEVDYVSLYNFINYIVKETKGEEIGGPHWVYIEDQEGPGKFFGIVGAVSKLWKEGITIKPRYALLKLIFNSKNIIGIISGGENESEYLGEKVSVTGKAIEQR